MRVLGANTRNNLVYMFHTMEEQAIKSSNNKIQYMEREKKSRGKQNKGERRGPAPGRREKLKRKKKSRFQRSLNG